MISPVLLASTVNCSKKNLDNQASTATPGDAGIPTSPGGAVDESSPPKPISILVTPSVTNVALGTSVRFSAIAVYPYGKMKDITDHVSWSSGNSTIAEFINYESANNLSTKAPGDVLVTASYREISGSTTITVSQAKILKLTASPLEVSFTGLMINGAFTHNPVSFKILGTRSDGQIQDITSDVTLETTDLKITLSPTVKGQFSASGPTSGSITIKYQTLSTILPVEAVQIAPEPSFITISDSVIPAVTNGTENSIVLPNGAKDVPIYATVTNTDTTIDDISSDPDFTLEYIKPADEPANQAAAFDVIRDDEGNSWEISARRTGRFTLKATFKGLQKLIPVAVTAGNLYKITISPSNRTMPLGSTEAFTAIGTYSDGKTLDLTKSVDEWISDDPSLFQFGSQSNVNTKNVLTARPVAIGQPVNSTVTIRARFGSIIGTTTVKNSARIVRSLEIRPSAQTFSITSPIPVGDKWKQQFNVIATYTTGSPEDVTSQATWSAPSPSGSSGEASSVGGLVVGSKPGTVNLTASFQGVTSVVPVTISEPTLESLTIYAFKDQDRQFPQVIDSGEITSPLGRPIYFSAVGLYSDNEVRPVTKLASWEFEYERPGYTYSAYVLDSESDNGIWKGYAKGVKIGETIITARMSGVQASVKIKVTDKEIESLTFGVNPSRFVLTIGESADIDAQLVYSDQTVLSLREILADTNLEVALTSNAGSFSVDTAQNPVRISSITEGYGFLTLSVVNKNNPANTVDALGWSIDVQSICNESGSGAERGYRYGLYCWYKAAQNQSCQERCTAAQASFVTDAAVSNSLSCSELLTKVFEWMPSNPGDTLPVLEDAQPGAGLGCTRQTLAMGGGQSIFYVWWTGDTPSAEAKMNDVERTCPCKRTIP